MAHARSRTRTRPHAATRILQLVGGALLACTCLLAAGTGFGADATPTAQVLGTLSLTDPTSLSAAPPVCTAALAPLDTDTCTDVAFVPGANKLLSLGALSGSDVQAGALQWRVTTTNPSGYRVRMYNAGAAPLLQGAAGSIADMSTSTPVPASGVDDATHFGVALGDASNDAEGAVAFVGSPWVTAGAQQGELFMGIPTAGMVVAERTAAASSDPFTATFAVAATAQQQPAAGSYAGLVRVIASAL